MVYFFKKVMLGFCFFILLSACSPSSSAQRYGSKQNNTTLSQKKAAVKKPNITARNVEQVIPDSSEAEFDEAPPQESIIDRKQFIANYRNYINPDVPLGFREEILLQVIKYLETPYKFGGNTENGIDCSGFTLQVYEKSTGLKLPRSAREQFTIGEKIERDDLAFGDLVFFNTRRRSNPGHVGIYIGDDQFIHSSTSLGVAISSMQEPYYKKRYVGARRVEGDEIGE
ncbi:MAG: spr protein product [Ignavibacteria bacterium]|nr:MAG: spr protein product [Ignavibacteria bacterium]KAF0157273.1 MAG: spr protein product [Ignavibacteria bacterium]